MSSEVLFTGLVLLVGLERVAELAVSRRNAAWSFARGAVEAGRRHFVVMVLLHTGLLVGAVAEVWIRRPQLVPGLAVVMLAAVLASQALRWWCIATLGRRWNTRVIVVPGLPLIRTGPYRWFSHPNYIAVVVEGVTLPLVHSAWVTAVVFTLANGVLLWVRIRVEEAALRMAAPADVSS